MFNFEFLVSVLSFLREREREKKNASIVSKYKQVFLDKAYLEMVRRDPASLY